LSEAKRKPVRRHTEVFFLRLTPTEAETLREAAADMGLTPQALVRMMIRNAKFLTVSVPPVGHE